MKGTVRHRWVIAVRDGFSKVMRLSLKLPGLPSKLVTFYDNITIKIPHLGLIVRE